MINEFPSNYETYSCLLFNKCCQPLSSPNICFYHEEPSSTCASIFFFFGIFTFLYPCLQRTSKLLVLLSFHYCILFNQLNGRSSYLILTFCKKLSEHYIQDFTQSETSNINLLAYFLVGFIIPFYLVIPEYQYAQHYVIIFIFIVQGHGLRIKLTYNRVQQPIKLTHNFMSNIHIGIYTIVS